MKISSIKFTRLFITIVAALIMLLSLTLISAAAPIGPAELDRMAQPDRIPLSTSNVITRDVPILMYHHIGGNYKSIYNIPTADFAAQMDYLAQHGYTTVSVDQVAAALRGQASLPPCPVAITFDDGYEQQYANAWPILQQHNFHATFYLVTGYISMSHAFMNLDQIKDLQHSGNWIGSHTYSHAFVGRLSGYDLKHQIVDANVKLSNELGVSVTTFAYPYGSYSFTAQRMISDSGFISAAWLGASYHQSADRVYRLSRIGVYSGVLDRFIATLPKHSPDGSGVCPAN